MLRQLKFQLTVLISICLFLISGQINAQELVKAEEKLSVNIGFGFPDLFNLGVRFLSDQHEMGATLGVFPSPLQNAFSTSVDYYYHFGGKSKLSARKPFYFRAGLTYLDFEILNFHEIIGAFSPRIGRDFNFSPNIGLQFDLGPSVFFYHKEFDSSGLRTDSGDEEKLGMSAGLALFYRI